MSYTPSAATRKAIAEFESLIKRSFRGWMVDAVRDGYSIRWMVDKSGLGESVIRKHMRLWSITPEMKSRHIRPHRPSSPTGFALLPYMAAQGYTDKRLYERVLNRMHAGMPYHQALHEGLRTARPGATKAARGIAA